MVLAAIACKRVWTACPRATGAHEVRLELPPAQAEKLRHEASRLGLQPEDLARAAVLDLLGTPDAEFQAAATRALQKNLELYGRLA
jgi:hypothetical protein